MRSTKFSYSIFSLAATAAIVFAACATRSVIRTPASAEEESYSNVFDSDHEAISYASFNEARGTEVGGNFATDVCGGKGTQVTLFGLNDLHGNALPRRVEVGSGVDLRLTHLGGVEMIGAYLDAVRAENPEGLLVLDSGDAYSGTLVSNKFQGQAVVAAYNALGVEATTFGNHEFDYGPADRTLQPPPLPQFVTDPQGSTRQIMRNAKFPYLSVNVVNTVNQPAFRNTDDKTPDDARFRIFEKNGIKIGVIGVTTPTAPKEALPESVKGLQFLQYVVPVQNAARTLRSKGANVVVLISHGGGACDMQKRQDDPTACGDNEISQFLKQVPVGTVDVVMAGHVHTPQANFINGTPVVQTFGFSSSFSRIDLCVDPKVAPTAARAARILKTQIEPPTYVCEQHFSNYSSCNPDELKTGNKFPGNLGAVIAPTYHGQKIDFKSVTATKVAAALVPWKQKFKQAGGDKRITNLQKTIANDRFRESPMGDCVADAVFDETEKLLKAEDKNAKLDLFFSHSGGIRSSITRGEVLFTDVFDVLPFGSTPQVVTLTGAELNLFGKALSGAENGVVKNIGVISKGWKIELKPEGQFPRHLGFRTPEGKEVDPNAKFTVVTDRFNISEKGPIDSVAPQVRAEKRFRELPKTLLDMLVARLQRAPIPASCAGVAPLDRAIVR